jgi:hypothetical protein
MVDSSRFDRVLTITVLPQFNTLEQTDKSAKSTRMRQNLNKYNKSTGILTCFPFDNFD